jgi:glyoxylase-like metal-dependent hydrolase (beta-lactamase superfamily II)
MPHAEVAAERGGLGLNSEVRTRFSCSSSSSRFHDFSPLNQRNKDCCEKIGAAVFGAIRGLGRSPDQLKHLIFTHGHPDHIGSAAAIVRETGARTYMHPLDIPMAESGGPFRPMRAAPGLLRRVMCKLFYHPGERLEPVAIDQPLTDGEMLPIAGGIEVIHTPGHCAGQVALLWRPGRMLFAGDVCTNLMGLGDPVGFESLKEGRASQRKLASLSFDAAGFGHGGPIARDASTRFRNKWGKKSSA